MSRNIFDKFLRKLSFILYLDDKDSHTSEKDKRKKQVVCPIETKRWPHDIDSVV